MEVKTIETWSRKKAREYIRKVCPGLKGSEVVHHRDGNPLNNNPKNLCIVSRSVHKLIHTLERQ